MGGGKRDHSDLSNSMFKSKKKAGKSSKKKSKTKAAPAQLSRAQLVKRPKDMGSIDNSWGPAMNTTGAIILPFPIANGAGLEDRIGRAVAYRGIILRGHIIADTAAIWQKVSLHIVYDKRPTGTLPAITDILETASPNALNNIQNSSRFRTIRRYTWVLTGANSATNILDNSIKDVEDYIDLKGKPVEYKSGGGTGDGQIGDIQMGALYFLVTGSGVAGTADATLFLESRLQFVDV